MAENLHLPRISSSEAWANGSAAAPCGPQAHIQGRPPGVGSGSEPHSNTASQVWPRSAAQTTGTREVEGLPCVSLRTAGARGGTPSASQNLNRTREGALTVSSQDVSEASLILSPGHLSLGHTSALGEVFSGKGVAATDKGHTGATHLKSSQSVQGVSLLHALLWLVCPPGKRTQISIPATTHLFTTGSAALVYLLPVCLPTAPTL